MTTPPLHMRRVGFDPAPELAAARDGGVRLVDLPQGDRMWLVTRISEVREVLGDARRFRVSPRHLVPNTRPLSDDEVAAVCTGNMLAFDPPEHTRLRKLLVGEFTARRMRALEPRVREVVRDRLDALERGGPPADLVADFGWPVPSLVICELLGVPYEDRDGFQDRTARLFDVSLSTEQRLAASHESRAYLAELVARARVEPRDDLLGRLARTEPADDELVGMADQLLLAGHETTANMLGLGVFALLGRPDGPTRMRADPEAAVEELLRWLSIVHSAVPRVVATEVELGGRTLAPGDLVLCSLSAANRDPDLVPDPDGLDLARRPPAGHVAFGYGLHHCLGAPLARMEMRIAFPELLERFPGLRLVSERVEFRAQHAAFGVEALPVAW